MRFAFTIILLGAVFALGAEEAAADSTSNTPSWLVGVTALLTAVIAWVAKMLHSKFKIDGEVAAIDKDRSLWEQKNLLIDQRIIPFMISTGEHWLITRAPALLLDAGNGGGFKWADHWTDLRGYVKARVIKKFASENIDIFDHLVETELDDLLDRTLTKLITLLPDSVTRFLPRSTRDAAVEYAKVFIAEKGKDLLSSATE